MLGYSIGLRALQASRQSMDIHGQNIANFATPGYTRKQVNLRTSLPVSYAGLGRLGSGVEVANIRRVENTFLTSRLLDQTQTVARDRTRAELLGTLESLLGEPGDSGITHRLDELFVKLSSLSGGATDPSRLGAVVQEASVLAQRFRDISHQFEGVSDGMQDQVRATIDAANDIARQLATVNGQLLSNPDAISGDLLDEQGRLLTHLSELVDVTTAARAQGSVDVLVNGRLLVSGSRSESLSAGFDGDGGVRVQMNGRGTDVQINRGQLSGLIELYEKAVPAQAARLDQLARELIRQFNSAHSTGIPANGPYHSLTGGTALAALAPPGTYSTLPLQSLQFEFPPRQGELVVNVVEDATGAVRQTVVPIDPARDSILDVVARLNAIDHLSAGLDNNGRLRLSSAGGYGFDFSARLDPDPDDENIFGSSSALLVGGSGPFALGNGNQLQVAVDGGAAQTLTFSSTDFADITRATPAEVAAVINAQLLGATARVVDGSLVLSSDTTGDSSSLQLAEVAGTPAAALGLSLALEQGSQESVEVSIEGVLENASLQGPLTIRAEGEGTIGLTAGLTVGVYDGSGTRVATLEVGDTYTPGEPLEIAPGVNLVLTSGEISDAAGDQFQLDIPMEGDSSDLLVSLEMAAFFTGKDAASIQVSGRLQNDPGELAISRTSEGDSDGIFALLDLQDLRLTELQNQSLSQAARSFVADSGRDSQAAQRSAEAQETVLLGLLARRDEISGVNLDEEMLRLTEMEDLFTAASRYLQVLTEMNQVLLNIL